MASRNYRTPVRPPRGTKVSKDTSGRLMNIIAELSVSKSNDDRLRKMQELKKDFEVSDVRLVQLISNNRDQLSVTMEDFSKISAKINTCRKGCRDVKEKLSACKKLLECKRDEIRRLWSESVEHREVISMLKEIEDLSKVRERVEDFLKEENFADATEVLVSSISLLEGRLAGVDALKDLRSELNALRETLHQVLVQELHKHLYMLPEGAFLKRKKDDENKHKSYEEIFCKRPSSVVKLPSVGKHYDFENDSNYQHIAIILECVTKLSRLPETVDILKDRCQRELMAIVRNSSQLMYDILQNSSYPCINNPLFSGSKNVEQQQFLLDLLQCILDQFRFVAVNHQSFLDNLQRIIMTKGLTDISYYEMADIYSKIQATIEVYVSDYIDLHNTAVTQRAATTFAKVPTATDISTYFFRKEINRSKKHSLFRFDGSSHAISMKSYLQEQKDSMKEKNELDSVEADQQVLICQPTAKNITIIFKSLKQFISELETALKMDSGTHCPLHAFLMDCVKVFLDEVNIEINRLIEKTTHSLETWKPVTDLDEIKVAEAKTQILNSSLTLNSSLKEMEGLIYSLPDYSSHFVQLVCNILQTYKELCYSAYKGLVCLDSDDRHIFSVTWARDKDISRLLRSLPNWTNLQIEDSVEEKTHEFEESPEEIRFRNKEESELLIRNLSCKDSISTCEIISDHNKLKNLALMHESMEWFSLQITVFAESLPDVQASLPSLIPEKFADEGDDSTEIKVGLSIKACLKRLAKEFEDLADTCLLVLHLEVRAHCFYYLLPLSKQGSYVNRKDDQEPEPEVVRLNSDLSKIDEALNPVLQQKKIKYVFEGLGELLSTILINSVSNIKKINENGVKKMGRNIFAIQQNLAGITMTREVALDRARQYFDLLNHTFEDILNQIVEEGPQFQEQEYSAIIQLLHNSREGIYDQDSLGNYREKLRQILDEVAVSV